MSDGGNRINQGPTDTGIRVKFDQTRTRQAQNTQFGAIVKEGMSRGADAVLTAGQLAAPFIPGAAVVSAAVTGLGALKAGVGGQSGTTGGAVSVAPNSTGLSMSAGGTSGTGGTTGAPGAGGTLDSMAKGGNTQAILMQESQKMQEMNMSFNMQYLMLQQKMQDESRRFTLLSNIMKTKHDTAKNSISNVR